MQPRNSHCHLRTAWCGLFSPASTPFLLRSIRHLGPGERVWKNIKPWEQTRNKASDSWLMLRRIKLPSKKISHPILSVSFLRTLLGRGSNQVLGIFLSGKTKWDSSLFYNWYAHNLLLCFSEEQPHAQQPSSEPLMQLSLQHYQGTEAGHSETAFSISTFIDGKCGSFPTCGRLGSGNFKPRTKAQLSFLGNTEPLTHTIKMSPCRDNSDFRAFDLIFTGTRKEWRSRKLFNLMPLFYRWARQNPEEYKDLLTVTRKSHNLRGPISPLGK